jgi:hypothetical protein
MNNNVCIICEYGWIIKGVMAEQANQDVIPLRNASVVRKWLNGKGIGGIAKAENKDEYVLDYVGDVTIASSKVLFAIPCEW